jgi:superfamily II DNA/RNA helicase
VRALVLLPTRELADQVAQQVKLYAKYTNLRSAVVFGGMDMKPQTLELKRGASRCWWPRRGACWTTSRPRTRC